MARQPKHISEVINEAVQAAQAPVTAKLIMVQRKFDRWFVYLKGVPPKQNPSCACKTAKSAIRYMYLLQSRYGAVISQNLYDRLQFEAQLGR